MPQLFNQASPNLANTTPQAITTGTTIVTTNGGWISVIPAANTTGVRLGAGTVIGAWIAVANESTAGGDSGYLFFYNDPNVSLVADSGLPAHWSGIPPRVARAFIWTGTYWYGSFDI